MSALLLLLSGSVFAHNPDTSYLRCRVAAHELELRFTFDPATLHRIVRPDADGDGKITRMEMEAATGDIFEYLEAGVRLEINGRPVTLGERTGLGWPAEAGEAVAEKDYHTQLFHFSFRCQSEALIEDFYIYYEVFNELGDGHRVMADVEQGGKHHEVVFTMFEPDYLYDTFAKPDLKDLFRRWVAAVWTSPLLLLVLVPPFILGLIGVPRRLVLPAAGPGIALMFWQFRGGLQSDLVWIPGAGMAVAQLLGALLLLPVFLCRLRAGS